MNALRLLGRTLHGVTYAVLLAVVLAVAALLALWWWTGTPWSLDWALQRYGAAYGVQAEAPTGSLRSGISAARLRWQGNGITVEATGVDLGWNPLALITRELKLTRLKADSVVIQDRRPPSPEPAQPPTDLRLPLEVTIDEFRVNRLRWQGTSVIEAADLAGRYFHDAKQHVLGVRSVEYAGGRYSGEMRLGAQAPLPLEARLRGNFGAAVPGSGAPVRLGFDVTLRGPLAQLEAAAQLQSVQPPRPGAAPGATATARITPWRKPIVPQAAIVLNDLDLAAFWPGAPRTALAGRVTVAPDATEAYAITADLSNTRSGAWDHGLLPLDALKADGEWRGGAAVVRSFTARLGDGTAEGAGAW
ncbi:MAG TPA: DUF490 domain-containing protein, partial [Ramlibacter sp.]|nr:DUF490 domain-containing protein [Ramlibacter sp.]